MGQSEIWARISGLIMTVWLLHDLKPIYLILISEEPKMNWNFSPLTSKSRANGKIEAHSLPVTVLWHVEMATVGLYHKGERGEIFKFC